MTTGLWETVENEVVMGVVLKIFYEEIRLLIVISFTEPILLKETPQTNQLMSGPFFQEFRKLCLIINWWSIQKCQIR